MQRSWRQDPDKLTFIVCRPIPTPQDTTEKVVQLNSENDSPENMVGDINLFLRIDDGDAGDSPPRIIGEIELMIAEKINQRRGYGKAVLLTFMKYIFEWEGVILEEFVNGEGVDAEMMRKLRAAGGGGGSGLSFQCLSVKIGQANERSLALFESLGFVKVSAEPNYFGEFELTRGLLGREEVDEALGGAGVEGYVEISYERRE